MAEDTTHTVRGTRLSSQLFEQHAGERIKHEGLGRETFHAMYAIFRLSSLIFNNLESTIYKPVGFSLAGYRAMLILWIAGDLERDGLVKRPRTATDRRLVTANNAQNAHEQEIFSDLSPDDLQLFIELIRRVANTYPPTS